MKTMHRNQLLKEVLKFDDFRTVFPRRYVFPNGYLNPDHLGVFFYCAVADCIHMKSDAPDVSKTISVLYANSAKNKIPIFFVSESLLKSLNKTDLPEGIELSDIKFPFPVLNFVLPTQWATSYFQADCPFLTIALVDELFRDHSKKIGIGFPTNNNLITGTFPVYKNEMIEFNYKWDLNIKTEKVDHVFEPSEEAIKNRTMSLSEIDALILTKSKNIALKLLMFMNSCSGFIENETVSRPAKMKSYSNGTVVKKDELWNPNFIGRNYVSKSEGASGSTKRMHWRRGHFRFQPYGPEMKMRKTIWIEPMIINATHQE